MTDLISRADAIEAVCKAVCEDDVSIFPECDQIKYCDEMQALLALPSADAVQGWIPCWERLPKEGEPVLITDCGYVDGLAWVAKDGAWESDHAYTDSVTAWMPLPKPYKGGEDDNA